MVVIMNDFDTLFNHHVLDIIYGNYKIQFLTFFFYLVKIYIYIIKSLYYIHLIDWMET